MLYRCVLASILGATLALPAAAQDARMSKPTRVERTQLPPPFGAQPGPQLPGREQCTPDNRKRTVAQIEAYEKLQSLTRNEGDQLCTLVENTEDLGKLDAHLLGGGQQQIRDGDIDVSHRADPNDAGSLRSWVALRLRRRPRLEEGP